MIVDTQFDDDVGELCVTGVLLDDEQRRRLLTALVSARGLGGIEAVEQAFGERPACGRLERLRERVDGFSRHEDVALRRITVSRAPSRPLVAFAARVRCGAAARVDNTELAMLAPVVCLRESLYDLVGGHSLAEERKPVRPVARVRVRLCRDRADVRLGPRDNGADREELRLRCNSPLTCVEVARDDRVRRDDACAIRHMST